MSDRKELKTNLINSFLILLSCCLGVAILINLRFQQDCATVIVGMLGVCAALYAPVAAFFLYDSWKEQHNVSIEKDYKKEIIQAMRKIQTVERKYDRLLANYLIYNGDPKFALPIDIDKKEVAEFLNNINNLLNLLTEYYEFTQDEDIKNKREYYFNYAQYYSTILYKLENISKSDNTEVAKDEAILTLLNTNMSFKFKNEGKEWTGHTKFGYAIDGLNKTGFTKFIVNKLRL